jgi:NTP pyrophosphatase (non-canonical NTP hydrolase)
VIIRGLMSLQEDVGEWAEETFRESTPATIALHLCEEAEEVKVAAVGFHVNHSSGYDVLAAKDREELAEECADVLLILLHLCHRADINLLHAANKKFHECKRRKWAMDPEKGYAKHVRD